MENNGKNKFFEFSSITKEHYSILEEKSSLVGYIYKCTFSSFKELRKSQVSHHRRPFDFGFGQMI